MKRNDLKASTLAAITRELGTYVPETTISRALSGQRNFENNTKEFLNTLLSEIEDLIQAIHPVPLSLKNPQIICRLLQEARNSQPDSSSLSDFILLSSVLSGQDLKEICIGRNISADQLRERILDISIKGQRTFDRAINIVEQFLNQ
jgi:hypothetical protein